MCSIMYFQNFLNISFVTLVLLIFSCEASDFECTKTGRFSDPYDSTCSYYYLCTALPGGIFIKNQYYCKEGTNFDPILEDCSSTYKCLKSLCSIQKDTFKCTSTGRFKKPDDITCTKYYLCTALPGNIYIKNKFTCSDGLFFDETIQDCTKNYNCICSDKTASTTISSGTSTSVTSNFVCKKTGQFINSEDVTGNSYFVCENASNDTFVQIKHSCPNHETCFDPQLQICSSSYDCSLKSNEESNDLKLLTTANLSSATSLLTTVNTNMDVTERFSIITSTPTSITSSTLKTCFTDDNNETEEFICSKKGRFLNSNDVTCTKYFLCNLLTNGSYVKTEYICPVGSWFNPDLQRCSVNYHCPCLVTTAITTSRKPTSLKSTELSSVEISTSTLKSLSTTTINSSNCFDYNNAEEFICKEKGRFFNPKDDSCTTYFLCNLLRNGSFLQTQYSCPAESWFDPEIQICSIYYNCPCNIKTTTKNTETETSTAIDKKSTTAFSTSTLTTFLSTTSVSRICLAYDSDIGEFKCSAKGRFFNPKDESCTKYFLCNLLRNGSFIQTEYTCPANSWFDPDLGICSIYYNCPCVIKTSTNTQSESFSTVTEKESTTVFTTSTLLPITSTISTPKLCLEQDSATEEFKCSAKGRFFNPKDESCTKYFLCNLLRNGSFVRTEYTCPANSWFDPDLGICSIYYNCPCVSETSTNTQSESFSTVTEKESTTVFTTSTLLPITSTISTPKLCLEQDSATEEFKCSAKGRFFNPKDESCTKYFLCNLLRNGSFVRTEYTCPANSWFDPDLGICSIYYNCPCVSETSTNTQSESFSTVTEKESTTVFTTSTLLPITSTISTPKLCLEQDSATEEFKCSAKGRFFNPKDESCTKYFLCNLLRNGSFVRTEYTCPANSWFDPDLGICSIYYNCPCVSETTTNTQSDSTATDKESTTVFTTSTLLPITSTISTPKICLAHDSATEEFKCSAKGRFFNPKDESCTKYFLCNLLRNGSFIQTEYTCPANSWFDLDLGICSIYYNCPCVSETTTNTQSDSTATDKESTTVFTTSTLLPITSTISTPNICLAQDSATAEFKCSAKGRFFNPKDESCTKYFLCNLLRNGSFVQTEYTCPANSWFDPDLEICSIYYNCPCVSETLTNTQSESFSTATDIELTTVFTTRTLLPITSTILTPKICLAHDNATEEFKCSAKGRFFNPKDESCTKYFLCNLLKNGSFIQTEYTCPANSWFDPDLGICSIYYNCPCVIKTSTNTQSESFSTVTEKESTTVFTTSTLLPITSTISTPKFCLEQDSATEEFKCSAKGRFFNPKDESCTKYFLCNLLRNGSFVRTEYTCPANSWFDPDLGICSIYYNCPCVSETSTNTQSESFSTATDKESTTVFTTSSLLPITSTISTPKICLAQDSATKEFKCSAKGRFFNLKDESCTKYFLCNLLRNGSFIQTEYTCPANSWFDPDLGICSIYYNCPCVSEPSTNTQSESFSTATDKESTTLFTTTTLFPITLTISTPKLCLAHDSATEEFKCSAKGRFFNPKDESCTKYFLCNLLRNGSFIQTEYTCPANSWFDPDLGICSIYYNCPCVSETTTNTQSDSTATDKESTTVFTTSTLLPITSTISTPKICLPQDSATEEFKCSAKGRFFNPKDESCTKYFLCNLLRNGSFVQTEYTCPANSWFDPDLEICSIYYNCPCVSETLTNTQSESFSTATDIELTTVFTTRTLLPITSTILTPKICLAHDNATEEFKCSAKGRFFNPKDESCTKYFLCNLLRNGSFVQTEYTCPANSWFDPDLGICSIYYNCLCASETLTNTQSESFSTATDKESTTVLTTSTLLPITSTISTPKICLAQDSATEEFKCSAKGRFFNPKDESCTKYFLCNLLRNGSFVQTEYTCPANSWFDPDLGICSIYYNCLCASETSTNTQSESFSTATDKESTTVLTTSTLLPITSTISTPKICLAQDSATEEFKCSAKGRFFNPKDESCTKYFLCNLLRNGSFVQTEYTCPANSWFDPDLEICSIYYNCPCVSETLTNTQSESFSTATDIELTTVFTTRTLLPITSTILTPKICLAHDNATEEFKCSAKGRFFNPKDESCTKYFLCNLLRNGSFVQTEYTCPANSWFDPDLGICSIYYNCLCASETSTNTQSESFSTATDKESTTVLTTSTLLPITSTISTPKICLAQDSATEEFKCSAKGRFFNPKDESCTKYFLCNLLRNGSFIQTEYTCPENSWFDPDLGICSIYYKCPCSVRTTTLTPTNSATAITIPSTFPTYNCNRKDIVTSFICTEKGRFINQNDSTCSTYFLCSLLRNGSLIQTLYFCPESSYFNPDLHICSIYYNCPCSLQSTTEIYNTD